MDANGYAGSLVGSGGRPQTHFFERGWAAGNDPYLDDTGLDARAVDASLDFPHEKFGKTLDRVGRHRYVPKLRREKPLARGSDDGHPRLARHFFEKSNVA